MVLALALNAVADTEGSDLLGGGRRRSYPAEGSGELGFYLYFNPNDPFFLSNSIQFTAGAGVSIPNP